MEIRPNVIALESGAMTAEVNSVSGALAEEAQRAFAFVANFGFSCISSSLSNVRYESDGVYFEIRLSGHDGELSICFGRLGKNEEFSFTLFLRLVSPTLEHALGERLVENREQLVASLKGLSEALRQNGQSILRRDELMFERMKHVRWWDFQPGAVQE